MSEGSVIDQLIGKLEKFLDERLAERRPLEPKHASLGSEISKLTYLKYARVFLRNVLVSYDPPLDEEAAKEFLRILSKRRRPRTVMVYYSAIKNLYYANGWSFNLRWTAFIDPEEVREFVERPYLTREEMERIIQSAVEEARRTRYFREALILILLALAMRPREIALLKVGSIGYVYTHLPDGRPFSGFRVEYKSLKRGRKTTKYIPQEYSDVVEGWLSYLKRVINPKILENNRGELPKEMPLFPRYVGRRCRVRHIERVEDFEPISYLSVYHITKKYHRVLGSTQEVWHKVMPYGFRIGVITDLLDSGYNPEDVDAWMGYRTPMSRWYFKKGKEQRAAEVIDFYYKRKRGENG